MLSNGQRSQSDTRYRPSAIADEQASSLSTHFATSAMPLPPKVARDLVSAARADTQAISQRAARAMIQATQMTLEFNALADRWRREATHYSVEWQQAIHPAYQQIIAMGEKALPLILEDLKRTRSLWFWALRALNKGVDVAGSVGTHREKVEAWLEWGVARGLIRHV